MANQPEAAVYDAGVLQLETTTPVEGGVGGDSNTPLLNLANRTAWLKVQVDALLADASDYAPINSPTFTGTPAAPTPSAGDDSTKIATTAFVQDVAGGYVAVNVAGGSPVTLLAAQYGVKVINLTGILTASINVIFPTLAGEWTVKNSTTGAFSVTCKTAAGTGIVVTQGKSRLLFGDGTNILDGVTDYQDAALTGNPTAPTPTAGDNDTSIATTAFVAASYAPKASPTFTGTSTFPNGANIDPTGKMTAYQFEAGTLSSLSGAVSLMSVENNAGRAAQFLNSTTGGESVMVRVNSTGVLLFNFQFGAAVVGNISTNGSTITVGGTSDYRLKKSVRDLVSASARAVLADLPEDSPFLGLAARRPVNFVWRNNPDLGTVDGYIAHEMQVRRPDVVVGEKDAVQAIGDIFDAVGGQIATDEPEPAIQVQGRNWVQTGERLVPQTMDPTKLIATMDAELHEVVALLLDARARIEALEAR